MICETLRLKVTEDDKGIRLDRFLAGRIANQTRSALRRWILDGRVDVDQTAASKPGQNVEPGMLVIVRVPPPDAETQIAQKIPVDIVFEDEHLLCVDKPAGMVVHPGHGCSDGTLVNALIGRGTTLAPAGAPVRPGIVHRLDQGTSGVIVVAKTDDAFHGLTAAFARRAVTKHYIALVWGRVTPGSGLIDRRIGRSRTHRVKMTVDARGGREAVTRYATRESMPGFSLLDARPETGRTHQIRVHLQSIHHPIVGDERYGGRQWKGVQNPLKRRALASFDRLALHAARLEFDHPVSAEPLTFEAPLPASFAELLEVLRC